MACLTHSAIVLLRSQGFLCSLAPSQPVFSASSPTKRLQLTGLLSLCVEGGKLAFTVSILFFSLWASKNPHALAPNFLEEAQAEGAETGGE